jgi:hypothetical protein
MNEPNSNIAPEKPAAFGRERRRETRFPLVIEIEVRGIDRDGHPFRAFTKTLEVSEWGCSFCLSVPVDQNSVVSLSVMGSQPHCFPDVPPVMFQIAHCGKMQSGWIIGASKIQPEKLWDVADLEAAELKEGRT